MLKKVLIFMCAICTLNCYAVNVHWGDIKTTTCESGDDIIVPTEEPTPQIGYHFAGWRMGLRQIEYLESTGTQWINGDFFANSNTRFFIDFETSGPLCMCSDYSAIFGLMYGKYALTTWGTSYPDHSYNGYFDYGGFRANPHIQLNQRGQISLLENTFTDFIGNKTTTTMKSVSYTKTMAIFAENGGAGRAKMKLYSLIFYDWTTPIRDFIPVIDENNVPCLYDKVEDKLYHNSGTGNFIAGSVVGSGGLSATRYTSGNTISNGCHGDLDDIYFYPVFEPNILTLNWDYKDETGRIEQTQCVYDTPITDVPEEPVRPGYKFMGWRVKVPE